MNKAALRTTRYAGSWYPAEPAVLEKQLDYFFEQAEPLVEKVDSSSSVFAIVVPHAGIFFSGEAAAHAYSAVKKKIKRIFLLGPSHYVGFHGVALPAAALFETPLGNIAVDQEAVDALKQHPLFKEHEEAHRLEHSLEMQLPFIKKVFEGVPIVPLVVGTLQNEVEILEIAFVLKQLLGEEDLIVVSSDFTHYGSHFGYEPFRENSRENIQKLDRAAYAFLQKLDLKGFLQFQKETGATICGLYPLAILLALLPKNAHASLLKYYTSRDRMPTDSENSVSYLAIAFLV